MKVRSFLTCWYSTRDVWLLIGSAWWFWWLRPPWPLRYKLYLFWVSPLHRYSYSYNRFVSLRSLPWPLMLEPPEPINCINRESISSFVKWSVFSHSRSTDSDESSMDFFEHQRHEIARWIANSMHNKGADPEKVHQACQALVQHTFSQVVEARKRGPSPITNRTMLRPGDHSNGRNWLAKVCLWKLGFSQGDLYHIV